jgi:hypothetical protein
MTGIPQIKWATFRLKTLAGSSAVITNKIEGQF